MYCLQLIQIQEESEVQQRKNEKKVAQLEGKLTEALQDKQQLEEKLWKLAKEFKDSRGEWDAELR